MLDDELARIGPAEVLYRNDLASFRPDTGAAWSWTPRAAWSFAMDTARQTLCKQFGTRTLDGFGITDDHGPAVMAAGAVMSYLAETQRETLAHFRSIGCQSESDHMRIDAATRRSLEITRTILGGGRDGSLLAAIDHCVTAMGSRRLADWVSAPLVDLGCIEVRHGAVGELIDDSPLRSNVRQSLDAMFDLSRLTGRVASGRLGPRDLQAVGVTLALVPDLRDAVAGCSAELLGEVASNLHPCETLAVKLDDALVDRPPVSMSEDKPVFRRGYDEELDSLRDLAEGGKQWIAAYQQTQIDATGIANIKVGFNKVFGYYLEITNTHRDRVPETFIRKQTLKNCERYITPELKEYEEKVLSAADGVSRREGELFDELKSLASDNLRELGETAEALATLDTLASLAHAAAAGGWVRPSMTEDSVVEIHAGRHPVLDVTLPAGEFVPNDTTLCPESGMIHLITGPNMAGKSTYIRQVALLTLMAQAGSFVPAEAATIGIADRIFARVGAGDELSRGRSTFMVEMVETARILNTASHRSLVILDEIGRGTSTYDGLSLAWAITEHLHDSVGARTLFATHYHELTRLEDSMPRVSNWNVAVKEWDDEIVFLHRIVRGGADQSYGVHVAKLAGLPAAVTDRAEDVLRQLEAMNTEGTDVGGNATPVSPIQMTLFGYADHPLLDEVATLDVDAMTPREAMEFLRIAQDRVRTPVTA